VDAKELRRRIYNTIECFSELYGGDGKAEIYSMIRDLEAERPPSGEGLADELRMANEARHGEGTYEARTLKVISHLIRAVKKLGPRRPPKSGQSWPPETRPVVRDRSRR
jgi:hypothetical protein